MKTQNRLNSPWSLCRGLSVLTISLALAGSSSLAKKPPQPPPEPGPGYRLVDLGTMGGHSEAFRINEAGWVVGASHDASGRRHPYVVIPQDTDQDGLPDLWARDDDGDGLNDLMIDLGVLGGGAGAESMAWGINDFGQAVGESTVDAVDANGNPYIHAVLWYGLNGDPASNPIEKVDLGAMTPEGRSGAWAINNQGQVVGSADTAAGTRAFLINPSVDENGNLIWYADGNGDGVNDLMIDLGSPFGGNARANAINDLGEIVGQADGLAAGEQYGFLIRPLDVDGDGAPDCWFYGANGINELMIPLPPLPGTRCEVNAVNLSGQVLGSSTDSRKPNFHWNAVLWEVDQNGVVYQFDLGGVEGEQHARARDLNDAGQAVGLGATTQKRFPYTSTYTGWLMENGNIVPLPDLILNWGAFDGENTLAEGINERAEITGTASSSGGYHAFIAIPVP